MTTKLMYNTIIVPKCLTCVNSKSNCPDILPKITICQNSQPYMLFCICTHQFIIKPDIFLFNLFHLLVVTPFIIFHLWYIIKYYNKIWNKWLHCVLFYNIWFNKSCQGCHKYLHMNIIYLFLFSCLRQLTP